MSDKRRTSKARKTNGDQSFTDHASRTLTFYINDEKIVLENPAPTTLLIDFLRYSHLGLTGTKLSCGEGGCGACTVMLSSYDAEHDRVSERAVNACLRPVCSLDAMMVTTTEGIGSTKRKLDPVQFRIAAYNGSQCGYCTPGFVMNMFTMLRKHPQPTEREIEDHFDGHICRCTGFRPILQAMKSFAVDYKEHDTYYTNHPCVSLSEFEGNGSSHVETAKITFPEELLDYAKRPQPLYFQGHGYQWFRPLTLAEVQSLKQQFGNPPENFKLVVGNTDIGIYKIDVNNPHVLVDVSGISEMLGFREDADRRGFHVGAANTLQELIEYLEASIARLPPAQTAGLVALRKHLLDVANLQVRNVGSLAGNVMMTRAHAETLQPFPSDLYLTFTTLGATVNIASQSFKGGQRTFQMLELPAPSDLPEDAVAVSFHIPYTEAGEYVETFKIADRIQNSHAIVNAGFRIKLDQSGAIEAACVAYGGLAPMTLRLARTEKFLVGQSWTEKTLSEALEIISAEVAKQITPMPGSQFLPAGYRESLTETLFYKFFLSIANQLFPNEVQAVNRSGGEPYVRPLSGGQQLIEVFPEEAPVGEPILKNTAFQQATGELKYTQDLPLPPHGLEAAVVMGQRANASFSYRETEARANPA